MPDTASLPTDATLRSVVPMLEDRYKFVPEAWRVIHRYQRECGPVVLRLGISRASKGKRPNYRIDHAETGAIVAVIDGNNHKEWNDAANHAGEWSTAAMTYQEVQELLKELRSHERLHSCIR